MMEDIQLQKSLTYLSEVETVAQDLLTAKDQKLQLSNARNKHNEALRALEKCDDKRTYIDVNNTFLQFPKSLAMEILKEDMENFTEEIDRLQEEIKRKASDLRDLEHQPRILGITLKPLSFAEAKALNRGFNI